MQPHSLQHIVKLCAAHFLSEAVIHWYVSEAADCSLKNIEILLEAATHSLKSKRYIQKQLYKFFHGFCTKYTHFVLKIFHKLSMIMKNIFDERFKNFVQECNTIILLHLCWALFKPGSLVPILGILGNFSIFLLPTNSCSCTLRPVIEASSGILSLPKWSHELALACFWHPHVQKKVFTWHFLFFCVCFQKLFESGQDSDCFLWIPSAKTIITLIVIGR